jgi:uncharacterized lipoprotein YajG
MYNLGDKKMLKSYLLLLTAFFLLIGCDQETNNSNKSYQDNPISSMQSSESKSSNGVIIERVRDGYGTVIYEKSYSQEEFKKSLNKEHLFL